MQLPSEYTDVEKQIRKAARDELVLFTTNIARTVEQQNTRLRALFEATTEFMTTGIADLTVSRPHLDSWMPGFKWANYFKKLAEAHNRPYVRVGRSWNCVRCVTMPKRKYLNPLRSMMLVLSTDVVLRQENSVDEWYSFMGDAGAEIYKAWYEQCRINPEYRRALRLDQ